MTGKSLRAAALAVVLFAGFAAPTVAGPISVFTQIMQAGGQPTDEIRFSGPGTFGVLTTGGGVDNVVTVAADQTSGRQNVVGYWPVLGYRDRAQYEAEKAAVVTIPETPVTIYAEVWNGEYGETSMVERVFFESTVSARVSATVGQTAVEWWFPEATKQVQFGETLVSIGYQPVVMPDGTPSIFFDDGSPGMGYPRETESRYYPTLLEATVEVTRPPTGPGDPPGNEPPPGVPEPASALLLAGLGLGGLVARRLRPAR